MTACSKNYDSSKILYLYYVSPFDCMSCIIRDMYFKFLIYLISSDRSLERLLVLKIKPFELFFFTKSSMYIYTVTIQKVDLILII